MIEPSEESPIRRVAFCPHCSNRAPQRLVLTQRYMERAWSADGEDEHPWSMFVAICETCNRPLLYENMGDQIDPTNFIRGDLEYPKGSFIDAVVPPSIARIYEEAHRIKEIAPNAYVVMIRRALEAIAVAENATGNSLQGKLNSLAEKGAIPAALAEATILIRKIGNIGAHADKKNVHPLLVYAIDDFFRAIIEYIYVAPKKLKEFKSRVDTYMSGNVDSEEN